MGGGGGGGGGIWRGEEQEKNMVLKEESKLKILGLKGDHFSSKFPVASD